MEPNATLGTRRSKGQQVRVFVEKLADELFLSYSIGIEVIHGQA